MEDGIYQDRERVIKGNVVSRNPKKVIFIVFRIVYPGIKVVQVSYTLLDGRGTGKRNSSSKII